MRKLILLGAITTVLLGASASGASATTWAGSCNASGTIYFTPPYTLIVQHHDYEVFGSGTCRGTLNGRPYDGPVSIHVDGRMNKPMSCEAGLSNDVPATWTFGDDPTAVDATRLDLVLSEFHVLSDVVYEFGGAYNGIGAGRLRFAAGEQEVRSCIEGGLRQLDLELEGHTITTLHG